MVGKLIKNEFKDSKDKFMPVIGLIISLAILITLSFKSRTINSQEILLVTIMLVVMALGIAIVVMSFMAFIDLLYTSLYNKNGYKLFTLPVETWEIIVAKIAVFFIWNVIIAIVSFLSIMAFLMITLQGTEILTVMRSLTSYVFGQVELRTILVLLLETITSNLVTISMFLFVGSIIHSTYVQNQRGIKMFVIFIIVAIILNQILFRFTGGQELALSGAINEQVILNIENFNPLVDGWDNIFTIYTNIRGLQAMTLSSLLYATVSLLLFMGTTWFWNHKLEIID